MYYTRIILTAPTNELNTKMYLLLFPIVFAFPNSGGK